MCVKGFALPAEDEMIGVAGFCDDPRYQLFPRDVERVFCCMADISSGGEQTCQARKFSKTNSRWLRT